MLMMNVQLSSMANNKCSCMHTYNMGGVGNAEHCKLLCIEFAMYLTISMIEYLAVEMEFPEIQSTLPYQFTSYLLRIIQTCKPI